MSGVLRRGSLNFDCNLKGSNTRGSIETNLYGGYRDPKPSTPEISVIALDFRRYSEDLKKEPVLSEGLPPAVVGDLSQDADADVISNFIGHHGKWQLIWTFLLTLFQIPPTIHLFVYTFQVCQVVVVQICCSHHIYTNIYEILQQVFVCNLICGKIFEQGSIGMKINTQMV